MYSIHIWRWLRPLQHRNRCPSSWSSCTVSLYYMPWLCYAFFDCWFWWNFSQTSQESKTPSTSSQWPRLCWWHCLDRGNHRKGSRSSIKSRNDNKIKINVFKLSVEKILLYGSESWALSKSLAKSLDGKYTRMLRVVSCQTPGFLTNMYGKLQPISSIVRKRRLALSGHVARRNEPASQLLLWSPDSKKKFGRSNQSSWRTLDWRKMSYSPSGKTVTPGKNLS